MNYLIIGSALSGNKGAASMLEASLQTISQQDPKAQFTLFSMYPQEDSALNTYPNLEIVPATPAILGALINPLALFYKLALPLRPMLRKQKHLRVLAQCDVYLDQGGITFVDGREKFLIYNVASILPALFLKKKVVKCSQALGSFTNSINKRCAKFFLPKVHTVFARGSRTLDYLQQLGIKNCEYVADYAFSLQVSDAEKNRADRLLAAHGFSQKRTNIGVFPSQVLRAKHSDYDKTLAAFIDKITATHPEVIVYILPHSQRDDVTKLHNNDMDVCQKIADLTNNKKQVAFVSDYVSPQQMRHIAGQFDMTVAARFHAMVSSLATGVPTLVTTWSHKYKEVLDSFGVGKCAYEGASLTVDGLYSHFVDIYLAREQYRKTIEEHLDEVQRSSAQHAKQIVSIAASGVSSA